MTTTTEEVESEYARDARIAYARAQRGARWLDENFPGWTDRINPGTLLLSTGQRCICGQLFDADAKTATTKGGWARFNGFEYARGHLFAEANGWISQLVRLRAAGSGSRLSRWERHEREHRVGIALGFMAGSLDHVRGVSADDREQILFISLQDAWLRLLAERGVGRRSPTTTA